MMALAPLLLSSWLAGLQDPGEVATKPPDTPAGRRLAEWLAAFNSGDPARWRAFIEESYASESLKKRPLADVLDEFAFVHDDTRGLTLERIAESGESQITAQARIKHSEDRIRLTLAVAPEPPHPITEVSIRRERGRAPDGPKPRLADDAIASEVGAFLDRLVEDDKFSGVVVIEHEGRRVFERVCGQASKAYGVANRLDTKFNLGSMNKMFTAVAIAQLAEQGKLRFDDPIGKHLPGFPDAESASKITIHHLLTHSSGLGSYFGDAWEQKKAKLKTVQDFLEIVRDERTKFEPGERFDYSNTGFLVLGAVVEAASGEDYFDYVREHIYAPAGMADTDAYELDQETPNLAVGYTHMGTDGRFHRGPWRNNLFLHVIKGGPAGGGYATAPDLIRFAEALTAHRLLGREMTETVLAPKIDTGRGDKYGYGFMITTLRGHPIIGHGGGFPGINSQLDIYPDLGYRVVVLSNYDMGAIPVVETLRDLIAR